MTFVAPILSAFAFIERTPAVRLTALGFGVLLVAAGAYSVIMRIAGMPSWPHDGDIGLYLDAADAIAHGASPYAAGADAFHRYPYPPLFADFLALLVAVFGERGASVLWVVAGGASLLASLWMLGRRFGFVAPWHWLALTAGLLLIGRTARSDLYHGQINFALLLLIVLGFYHWRAKREILSSALWAIAICCKPFLGVIVLFLLAQRDRRGAAMTFVLSGALFAASFAPMHGDLLGAFFGWRETTQHYTSPEWAANPLNQSFYGLLLRLFTANPFSHAWMDAPLLVPLGLLLVAAPALGAFWIAARATPAGADAGATDLARFGVALAAVMSLGPVTEGDHLYFVLPGVVGCFALTWRRLHAYGPRAGVWSVASLAWLFAMAGVLSPRLLPTHFVSPDDLRLLDGAGILLSGGSAYGLLAAATLTASALWLEQRNQAAAVAALP